MLRKTDTVWVFIKILSSLKRNNFPKRPSGAPLLYALFAVAEEWMLLDIGWFVLSETLSNSRHDVGHCLRKNVFKMHITGYDNISTKYGACVQNSVLFHYYQKWQCLIFGDEIMVFIDRIWIFFCVFHIRGMFNFLVSKKVGIFTLI